VTNSDGLAVIAETRTYGQLFRIRGFGSLFTAQCLIMASSSISSLALGNIVYSSTSSTVLTALSMFGGPLISLVVSSLFLSMSDFLRPRTGLVLTGVALLVADVLQVNPGLPWGARFAFLSIPWAMSAATAGSKWLMLGSLVDQDAYLLGRSTLNIAVGVMQVVGFATGGVLLNFLDPVRLFIVAAGVDLVLVLLTRFGLPSPGAKRTAGGTVEKTRRTNVALLKSPVVAPLYLSLWLPNGIIVGCESLFVPFAGAVRSGWLFSIAAAGMMIGDVAVGRYIGRNRRDRLIRPLRLLLAAPYVFFVFNAPFGVAVVLALVASIGYAASLPLQDRLIAATDPSIRGQVLGLHSTGLAVSQAIGAALAGTIATFISPGRAIGVVAVVSMMTTLALSRGLRKSDRLVA